MQIYVPKTYKTKKVSVFPGFSDENNKKGAYQDSFMQKPDAEIALRRADRTALRDHAAAVRITSMPAQTEQKAAAEILRRLCPKTGTPPVYFVTRSSHLTMASMANIEMAQTMTKMLHVAEIEMRL